MTTGLAALALMIQAVGAAAFPDDAVRWTYAGDAATYDAATGVLAYSAVPSADVGCGRMVRFVVAGADGGDGGPRLLAVYCERDGAFELLATGEAGTGR